MKFQTLIRTQFAIAGLGAALLLPATVQSQEITNTVFNEGPNVVALEQSASVQAPVANSTSASTNSVEPIKVTTNWPAEQAGFTQVRSSATWETPVLLVCVAVLALYALVEAKRANRNLRAHGGQYVSPHGA